MDAMNRYYLALQGQFEKIRQTQWEKIDQAAQWLGESLSNDGWLYAFGTGHSHLLAEEIFYRAGNPARATPILDPALMLHENAIEATYKEREEGYGKQLLALYPIKRGDVLIVASNSGRNAVPIEIALEGRERGLRVISISNLAQSTAWPSRHSSGKRLFEVADLSIDNCGVNGDSCIEVAGLPGKIGPTTTSTGALIVNAIIVQGLEYALQKGRVPEIYISSNTNGDDHNDRLLQKYKSQIRHL
ncbi:MAG: hypothetical protein ABS95_03375 [Verrucomicrobia bacterium SCN 57-15]|nr:MAG: hypothetical protein ABS95_03375 [Verrucomicrobia bacterium SCN 57-15]